MNWASVADFLAMGGRGLYVWGSYAVFAIAIIGETIMVIRRQKTVLRGLRRDSESRGNQ